MTVSIIIPAYNAAATLRRCVNSVLSQTVSDWELLLVDDGSTDGTAALCDAYASSDPLRIRAFHKPNGGVSSARNAGMARAAGEYLAFIDADDRVDTHYLALLLRGRGADMAVTGCRYGSTPQKPVGGGDFRSAGEIGRHAASLINADRLCFPVAKLFRRDITERHGLRFAEDMRFAEDNVFCWQYLLHAETLYVDAETPYQMITEPGHKPYRLTFAEMETVDSRLHALRLQLEARYGRRLDIAPEQLFHAAFLGDMTERPATALCRYYLRYHPGHTPRQAYAAIAATPYYLTLRQAAALAAAGDGQQARALLGRLAAFLDAPLRVFRSTSIATRFLIPLVRLRLHSLTLLLLRAVFRE